MKSLTTNTILDGFLQAVILTDAQRRMEVTNEQSLIDLSEANEKSICCNATVIHDGGHTFCEFCGEYTTVR